MKVVLFNNEFDSTYKMLDAINLIIKNSKTGRFDPTIMVTIETVNHHNEETIEGLRDKSMPV